MLDTKSHFRLHSYSNFVCLHQHLILTICKATVMKPVQSWYCWTLINISHIPLFHFLSYKLSRSKLTRKITISQLSKNFQINLNQFFEKKKYLSFFFLLDQNIENFPYSSTSFSRVVPFFAFLIQLWQESYFSKNVCSTFFCCCHFFAWVTYFSASNQT